MALARVKVWVADEVLFADDLNAEFDNLVENPISLVSPWTGSMAAGGFDLTGLDELAFDDADADASAAGRLRRTDDALEWHDRTGSWPLQPVVGGSIFGLTLSNNSGDATNDIDIAVGQAIDDSEVYTLRLTSGLTKRIDATWAVGTNQGGLASGAALTNTTYHVFIIKRTDTGVTDVAFDSSATGANIAANTAATYTIKRRIGSVIRTGGSLKAFTQLGDHFIWTTPLLDITATNPGTSAVTRSLASVPNGVQVTAHIRILQVDTGSALGPIHMSPMAATDQAASASVTPLGIAGAPAANVEGTAELFVETNTAQEIRSRSSSSSVNTTFSIATLGYHDRRGKDV